MWRSAWQWIAVALLMACDSGEPSQPDDSPVDTPDIDDTIDETDEEDSDTDPFETGWDHSGFNGDTGDGRPGDSGGGGPGGPGGPGPGGGDTFIPPDSSPCAYGEVPDCDGNCYPTYFIGDGTCDDGSAYQSNFDCVQFSFDGGDCDGVDTDTLVYIDSDLGGCEWTVHIDAQGFAHDMGWQIQDTQGRVAYDMKPGAYGSGFRDFYHTVVLPDGDYTFVMLDSSSDGWSGSTYEVIDPISLRVLSTGTLSVGGYAEKDFVLDCEQDTGAPTVPPDCGMLKLTLETKPWAADIGWRLKDAAGTVLAEAPFATYVPTRTYEYQLFFADGSYIFEMADEGGDGWNGSTYVIEDILTGRKLISGTMLAGYREEVPFEVACSETAIPIPPPVTAECDPVKAVIHTALLGGDEVGWEVRHGVTGLLAGSAPSGTYDNDEDYTVDLPIVTTGPWTVRLVDSAGNGWGDSVFELVDSTGGLLLTSEFAFAAGFEYTMDIVLDCPVIEIPVDTAVCAPDTVVDCAGVCWPISYVGDGFCDDGSTYAANFYCSDLMWDMGDCGPPP